MGLIGHAFQYDEPAFMRGEGALFSYLVAGNGVFLKARREGLQVEFPIVRAEIRGLEPSGECFDSELPLVPLSLVTSMLVESGHYAQQGLETLFHFVWSVVYPWDDGWQKIIPEQERHSATCRPLDADAPESSYQKTIIEVHSHHSMPARFSKTDNKDETGFRLYGVVGRLDTAPEIRMRVGVYGQFWEIPASWVMEMPEGLRDCNAEVD